MVSKHNNFNDVQALPKLYNLNHSSSIILSCVLQVFYVGRKIYVKMVYYMKQHRIHDLCFNNSEVTRGFNTA